MTLVVPYLPWVGSVAPTRHEGARALRGALAGMGFLLLLLVEAALAELNCRRMPGGCGGKAARRARNRLHAAAATVPSVSMANVSRRVERMLPTTTPAPAAVALARRTPCGLWQAACEPGTCVAAYAPPSDGERRS